MKFIPSLFLAIIATLNCVCPSTMAQSDSEQITNKIQTAISKTLPAVVVIKLHEDFMPGSIGSGVIIRPDGWIVTNAHVLKSGKPLYVQLEDGSMYSVTKQLFDEISDIGVMKIDAPAPLPTVPFGNSDELKLGESVLTIGSPFSLGVSVSAGIVSGKYRAHPGAHRGDMIQTDALINPGNSGGGLFDLNGNLVGITTSRFAIKDIPQGIGFAIPSNLAQWVCNQLSSTGKIVRYCLGVELTTAKVSELKARNLPVKYALRITDLDPDGKAKNAGLKVNDIVLDCNVAGRWGLYPDLAQKIAVEPENGVVILKVHHADTPGDSIETIQVPLTQVKDDYYQTACEHLKAESADKEVKIPLAGFNVSFESKPDPHACVTFVQPGSVADDCGFTAGMNIKNWNGKSLEKPEDLINAINSACISCGQVLIIEKDGAVSDMILKKNNYRI